MKSGTHNLAFIVEDNEMYSTMLDYLLSTSCICRFVSFKTGEECIQNLHMNPFIVILDYGLPGMDGLQTIEKIKEHKPDTEIVVLTSNNDKGVARSFFNAGAYEYLLKEKNAVHRIVKIINSLLSNTDKAEYETNDDTSVLKVAVVVLALMLFISVMAWNL